ncbi:hypothetical protein HK104_010690 [Borealophlyctis nickersoniae]|nr:hypothetical protein HK104_010690 [Borealophlyctis nickersoniae]
MLNTVGPNRHLTERRAALPPAWSAACIDYVVLKDHIKQNVKPYSLNLSPDIRTPSFAEAVQTRMGSLQTSVAEFFRLLDAGVDNLAKFYVEQCAQLKAEYEEDGRSSLATADRGLEAQEVEASVRVEEARKLLQDVVKLERFVFMNYTGITKIMKKLDRHSGLRLSEAYLYRLTFLPFYQSETVLRLKKRLIEEVSGTTPSSTNGVTTPTAGEGQETAPGLSLPIQPSRGTWFPPASIGPQNKVLVSMSGPHGTDIIGAVLDCVARHKCNVDDFVLSRLYHNVTFGCLINLGPDNVDIFRDLADAARKWDATLFFDVQDQKEVLPQSLEDAPYSNRTKYTATVLNQDGLTPQFLFDWTRLLLDERISVEKMTRLSAPGSKLCSIDFRLSVPAEVDFDALRAQLFQLSATHHTDVALQPNDVFRKNKRLVIFDMDSTLIQQEVIDEIAKHAGVVGEVARITELAMNGEIDFKESLRRRVNLLKGTPVDVLQTVKSQLTFTEGAHFLCRALKRLGFKLAVISGGFMPLALYVKGELGLDYAFANQLRVSPDGKTLTGETIGPIVDGQRKAELLEVIAQAESVTPEQVIAVGDGANDLLMLAAAGLGIAFNAKPKVQKQARARINQTSLRNVLYLLGYTDDDAKELADSC